MGMCKCVREKRFSILIIRVVVYEIFYVRMKLEVVSEI
jgi:hypothetical protein